MKKNIFIAVLLTVLAVVGSCITVYKYLNANQNEDYKNGMFVDRGCHHGYATVYSVCQSL